MLLQQTKSKARMSTEEAKGGFLLHSSRLSPSTRANYARIIKRFENYAPSRVTQITAEHIESYLMVLRSKGYKATTLNLHLSALKSLFGWLEDNYGIPNVAKKVKCFRTLPPHRRTLSRQEYQAVVAANNGYVRDVIQILANSGLRASEFVTLKPENVDGEFLNVVGKGGRFRRIPLNRTLKNCLQSNPFLMLKSHDRSWLNRLCNKAAKVAGIEPFSPHSLRRYFATELYRQGVSLLLISRLMGHSSIKTTEIYINLDNDLLHTTDCLD